MRYFTLPCLFTSSNLFCGFVSLFFAFSERFMAAAWLLIIALAFDIMDGRVARLTRTSSEFGAELDSLADLVSFGVAPASLFYFCFLEGYIRYGIFLSFLFVLAAAFRLARFNVEEHDGDFSGLPTPGAAFTISALVIFAETYPVGIIRMPEEFFPILIFVLSIMMVSKLRFPSAKQKQPVAEKRRRKLTFGLALLLAILTEPAITLPLMALVYIGSGPVLHTMYLATRKLQDTDEMPESDSEEKVLPE